MLEGTRRARARIAMKALLVPFEIALIQRMRPKAEAIASAAGSPSRKRH
jgi:hypothetical protein